MMKYKKRSFPVPMKDTFPVIDTCWQQLSAALSLGENAAEELVLIKQAYAGKKRYYHNQEHIAHMLDLAISHKDLATDSNAVTCAVFYHDIVYEVPGSDNEHKSALRAAAFLAKTGVPAVFVHKVCRFIEATKQHIPDGDPDLDFLLDLDLQILAADPDVYRRYTVKIRKEYSIYPDLLYRPGRKKVLQHFLAQPALFKTPAFREQYEKQARENLLSELATL